MEYALSDNYKSIIVIKSLVLQVQAISLVWSCQSV